MHALWFLGSLLLGGIGGCLITTVITGYHTPQEAPWFCHVTMWFGLVLILVALFSAILSVADEFKPPATRRVKSCTN